MPGITVEEELHGVEMPINNPNVDEFSGAIEEPTKPSFGIDLSFLTKETGDGEIEDYLTHPMNFKKSVGMAQIIRGITGLVGSSLKYALLDITMGLFRMQREKITIDTPVNEVPIYNNGNFGS